MTTPVQIADRTVGPGQPVYVVAELSANHGQDYDTAVKIVQAAKAAGADAIKLQTYTADTITVRGDQPHFRIGKGSPWAGQTLHDLYARASTPWDWHPRLRDLAAGLGLHFFSSPFDDTAVRFLESLDVPAYKIASFELVDLPLIRRVASTGKPLILSTGMASRDEIREALDTAREAGARQVVLLKCTSAYPAPPEEMDLPRIPEYARQFGVPVGLSDHTLGIEVPIAAVALGAVMIEKHLTLSRRRPTPDSAFSLEPDEFRRMVEAVRTVEKALTPRAGTREAESPSRAFRRSLFVVRDVRRGDILTLENVRSIRPAAGLHPRHLEAVLGKRITRDAPMGTPLAWDLIGE